MNQHRHKAKATDYANHAPTPPTFKIDNMNCRESPRYQGEDSGVIKALEEVLPFTRIQGVVDTAHRQEENRTDGKGQTTDAPVPASLAELPEKPGKINYDGNKQPMRKGGNGLVHA